LGLSREVNMAQEAVLLAGSLGLGHEMMARSCTGLLEASGWRARTLNSMGLLGPRGGVAGEKVFGRLLSVPVLYDGLHFSHLRTGSSFACWMDRCASTRLVPALRAELERQPADLVLSVFATGASAAAKLKAEAPDRRTVVLCTDVAVHRLWVWEGTDLFLVTSEAAAASVRRFLPRAAVSVVPRPVRETFYSAPSQPHARQALGIPSDAPCVLLIDSGWGFGPLVEAVACLARSGVHVLAVAGRQPVVERQLRSLAMREPLVRAFGFTDRVPELMAASDAVVALPGATTCSEARVVGRPLLLLDVMPGHGRDNLLHELELGGAEACGPTPAGITASALALLERVPRPAPLAGAVPRWKPAFVAALQRVGVDLSPALRPPSPAPAPLPAATASSRPQLEKVGAR
jgi:processive 1,2-diacylglycerol beta-glucosyltransferase